MPRKKKGQEEKPLNFRTIQQIRDEKANKKIKEKFVDYNSDTLAARRDDIIKLVDDNAQNFEKDNIELKKEFLKALCYGNPIRTTAQMLGVSRQRIYELKKKDPVFAACVDDIVKDLEFAKVVDIKSELLEIKDVFNAAFVDLYNNGLFVEAAIYQKEANRISERFIDRHVQKQAREEDLKMREKELEARKDQSEADKSKRIRVLVEHIDKNQTVAPDDYK